MIELGERIEDKFTGCGGTATARAEFLGGAPQILVEYSLPDGTLVERWVYEHRLRLNTQ